MTRRANAYAVAVLCAGCAALALPALGEASSGGGGLSGSSSGHSQSTGSSGSAQPGNVPVSASGGGITIQTRSSAFLSNGLSFTGSAPSRDAGKTVTIERSGHETNWAWTPTVQARIGSNGSFSAVWDTNHIGQFSIRAVLSNGQGGATSSSDWPTVTVIVYRPSIATWYADNGSRTACGVVLHRNTVGVANRTLPCGTQVAIYYRGKSVIVPVIDRGPYANHADWDLTAATARMLSVYNVGVAHVGAVSLPRR